MVCSNEPGYYEVRGERHLAPFLFIASLPLCTAARICSGAFSSWKAGASVPCSAPLHFSLLPTVQDGAFGIRIENLFVVKEADTQFRWAVLGGQLGHAGCEVSCCCPLCAGQWTQPSLPALQATGWGGASVFYQHSQL